MAVNRKELARRIARMGGYDIGSVEDVLKIYEDVIIDSLERGEEIKQGKLWKIQFQKRPEKKAWNGLAKVYFTRPAKLVPKVKFLSRMAEIELPVEDKEA